MCDQIADAVLDAILAQDPSARVACEVATTTGLILLMGEVTTTAQVDVAQIARQTVREIGYDRAEYGFDADTCAVITAIHGQSPDIAQGVDRAVESRTGDGADPYEQLGAGDQGLIFGFAADETPELMPLPITLAHRLAARLAACRKSGRLPYLRPDGKTQVTVEYEDDRPVRLDTVVVSTQHDPGVSQETIRDGVVAEVIRAAVPEGF
ncbi:MAG TPA: S-adenosylmethionine synthetase N-terminal domain-containing protein, partial [Limnochordia bacterium]